MPHLQKQTSGPPPGPAHLRASFRILVTLHPSLWPTLPSPLQEVHLVAQTMISGAATCSSLLPPPLRPHPVLSTLLSLLDPSSLLTTSLPPCSPPPWGPTSARSQREPVSIRIRSCPWLLRVCGSIPLGVKDNVLLTCEAPTVQPAPLTSPPATLSLSPRSHPHKHLTLPLTCWRLSSSDDCNVLT